MKKIIIPGVLFFIILPQIFADEKLTDFEKYQFNWLFTEDNQEIDFKNLNPFFLPGNGIFLVNTFDSFNQYTSHRDNQNHHDQQLTALGHIFEFFGVMAFWTLSTAATPSGRQDREIYFNRWEQQREAELFNQRIFNDPDRKIY